MGKMIAILLTAGVFLVAVSSASYAGCKGGYYSSNGGSYYHFNTNGPK